MATDLTTDLHSTANRIVDISIRAGLEIMKLYKSDYKVSRKSNFSTLTDADILANDIILAGLKNFSPDVPIISEESYIPEYSVRSQWRQYWLIDPIDGTNSFVRGRDQFTVNIALIENNYPILGAVYLPVEQTTYWGAVGLGAFRIHDEDGESAPIRVNQLGADFIRIIAPFTRTHQEVKIFTKNLESDGITCEVRHSSSSIKFCRVAEGAADIFPNFGPTSEWDTGAAQCVVECAGGSVVDLNGNRMRYNKPDSYLENPRFFATGAGDFDWRPYLP